MFPGLWRDQTLGPHYRGACPERCWQFVLRWLAENNQLFYFSRLSAGSLVIPLVTASRHEARHLTRSFQGRFFFLKSKELPKRCVNTIWVAYFRLLQNFYSVFFFIFWSNRRKKKPAGDAARLCWSGGFELKYRSIFLLILLAVTRKASRCNGCSTVFALWIIKAGKWFLILALLAVAT